MKSLMPSTSKGSSPESPDIGAHKSRSNRAKKRKHLSSESSSGTDDVLPENTLEVEKNLHASAVKNNLDDVSVKKILKKVVTNDHVLALVKLREEEEEKASKVMMENPQPKLTRSKAKELKKVSSKTGPWNLENLELTPIKHIPVKTRPEVKALIAQELQEDEEDDEYEPTHDDVPSDDDFTLESCSDVDSQPRTPATPRRLPSPKVIRDGPFKVPQDISTSCRKLDVDEDATIALRTRSKLSLSSIPIDQLESSFVLPDELPMPVVDDIWTEFLQECMNPETSKNEDDDDDPEYNVAADPDAHEDDEEGLENIMRISKKELNDLVTELFNIMPEATAEDALSGKLANEVAPSNSTSTPAQSSTWEGKQEVISDDEMATQSVNVVQTREQRTSIGKSEPLSDAENQDQDKTKEKEDTVHINMGPPQPRLPPKPVTVVRVAEAVSAHPARGAATAPASVRSLLVARSTVTVQVEKGANILPEQISILQQQLRQHIQLAASHFLQLCVHPVHWTMAPAYKDYLETLNKMTTNKANSVASVCNLKPALALVRSWEESVSADTPENAKMVQFVQKQVERARRRAAQNSLYVGDFHETFLNTVANSSVFLYPHLLPPLPFRSDGVKRFSYLRSEDDLIALAIDEFWQYVEDNPNLFKVPNRHIAQRWGLVATVQLVCRHLMPWVPPKALLSHVQHVRKSKDPDNSICKFFKTREVTPVKHILMPFNPNLTLYEQPESEMPRIWVRHLAKSSKRFRDHLYRRSGLNKVSGTPPAGVAVDLGTAVTPPQKKPLPIGFTKEIVSHRLNLLPPVVPKSLQDKFDIELTPPVTTQTLMPTLFSVIQTPAGAYLIPLSVVATNTVNSASTPICTSEVKETVVSNIPEQSIVPTVFAPAIDDHCECCTLLRKICKVRQTFMTDFFTPKIRTCPCRDKRRTKYPKVTRKLRLLLSNYKNKSFKAWQRLQCRIHLLTEELKTGEKCNREEVIYDMDEIAAVTAFQLKLTVSTTVARNSLMKKKIHTLLSRFDPDADNIYSLVEHMDTVLAVECVDVFKEFLGFLTMEQADEVGRYMDYFKQECLADLMKQIEEQVSNRHHKLIILTKLRRVLTQSKLGPCEICWSILDVLRNYPKLANLVFSMFPHRREKRTENREVNIQPKPSEPDRQENQAETAQLESQAIDNNGDDDETRLDDTEAVDKTRDGDETVYGEPQTMDYEADHSASDDDGSVNNLTIVEESEDEEIDGTEVGIKDEECESENVIDTPHLTVTKTEVQDYSESEMSMMIMTEEEVIKSEPLEWTRDEDKLLLEVVKQSLSPVERIDKTILEIIDEKIDLQALADNLPQRSNLPHKSLNDIRERILYLLQILVSNVSDDHDAQSNQV